MLNAALLKEALKSDLITLFENCKQGNEGMTTEDYADQFAQIIAEKIVNHIKDNASVVGSAGPYPVTGNIS